MPLLKGLVMLAIAYTLAVALLGMGCVRTPASLTVSPAQVVEP
jgi:hypothetical protein